jgi:hypothetical protein
MGFKGGVNGYIIFHSETHIHHLSSPANRSMVGIDSTTNEKFLLWNSNKEINIILLGTL